MTTTENNSTLIEFQNTEFMAKFGKSLGENSSIIIQQLFGKDRVDEWIEKLEKQ